MSRTIKGNGGFYLLHHFKKDSGVYSYWYFHIYNPQTKKMETRREDPPKHLLDTTEEPTQPEKPKPDPKKSIDPDLIKNLKERMKWSLGKGKRGTDGKLYKAILEELGEI